MKLRPVHVLPLLLAGILAGCAGQGKMSESGYVPQQGGPGYGPEGPAAGANAVPGDVPPSSGAQGSSNSGATSNSAAPADQRTMCELHRRLMAARSQDERQALIAQAMPGMSPSMQQQHLDMMREQCQ
jgi:hypothetical protein